MARGRFRRNVRRSGRRKRMGRRARGRPRQGKSIRTFRMGSSTFPKSVSVPFKYVDDFILTPPSGGAPKHHFYSCNSLFKPDTTLPGHQPLGFDQWMLMYDHYIVMGAKITVKVSYANDTSAAHPVTCVVIIRDQVSTSSSATNTMEQPNAKWVNLGPQTRSASISHKWSARRAWGIQNPAALERAGGTTLTSPADQQYFAIVVFPTDQSGVVDVSELVFQVNLSFRARLSENKFLGAS